MTDLQNPYQGMTDKEFLEEYEKDILHNIESLEDLIDNYYRKNNLPCEKAVGQLSMLRHIYVHLYSHNHPVSYDTIRTILSNKA